MSYTLQAIVGARELLEDAREHGLAAVELSDTLVMVPLTDEVRRRFGIPEYPLTDEDKEPVLPESLGSLCRTLSHRRVVAYLEAEIFGGVGMQAHVLFRDGVALSPPVVGIGAINQALRHFDVRVGGHYDEFDAVGLGRHRDTDGWAREPE